MPACCASVAAICRARGARISTIWSAIRNRSDHELRIIGAYQGLFLSRLRELCAKVDAGAPRRFKIELTQHAVLSYDVKDGYYVVLLADTSLNEGLAWRRLEKCRERLIAEM